MRNGQFFRQVILMSSAMLTCKIISMSSKITLSFPTASIDNPFSSLPVRTIFANESSREPSKTTHISAKTFRGETGWNSSFFSTHLACISYSISCAFFRAVSPPGRMRRKYQKNLAALLTCQIDQRFSLSATFRAIFFKSRFLGFKFFPTLRTRPYFPMVFMLTLSRTINRNFLLSIFIARIR